MLYTKKTKSNLLKTYLVPVWHISGTYVASLLDNAPNYLPIWVRYPKENKYLSGAYKKDVVY